MDPVSRHERIILYFQLASYAEAVFGYYFGRDQLWQQIFRGVQCFLRIFDLDLQSRICPGADITARRRTDVQSALADLPSQPSNTIRVYLEDNLRYNSHYDSHLKGNFSREVYEKFTNPFSTATGSLARLIPSYKPSSTPRVSDWWASELYEMCDLDRVETALAFSATLIQCVRSICVATEEGNKTLGIYDFEPLESEHEMTDYQQFSYLASQICWS
jgi:hypothetical protein